MTAHIRNGSALAKVYSVPRDNYVGEFLPAIVEVREPVRVVSMRRSGNTILLAIAIDNHVDYWRLTSADDHRLQVLGADDRNQVQGLLISIKREVGDAG